MTDGMPPRSHAWYFCSWPFRRRSPASACPGTLRGDRPFSWSLFYEHFHQLGKLWKNRNLRVSEMGIGYFWFFGGTVMLMTIQMAKEISGGGDDFSSVGAVLMAWMSGGTVLGGILASVICRRHIRMNVSVAGGVLMAASCAALAAVSMASPVFNALLMAAGISAALFLVPLNAFFPGPGGQ